MKIRIDRSNEIIVFTPYIYYDKYTKEIWIRYFKFWDCNRFMEISKNKKKRGFKMSEVIYIKTKINKCNLTKEEKEKLKYLKFLEDTEMNNVVISHEMLHQINKIIDKLQKKEETKFISKGMLPYA